MLRVGEIIQKGDELRRAKSDWVPCHLSIGNTVDENDSFTFRRPRPTKHFHPNTKLFK